jgi:DNA-binding NarL/FixJ family response regulator
MPDKTFIIADNQFLVTESLRHLLESETGIKCIGIATAPSELIGMLIKNPVDILVVDPDLFVDENFTTLKNVRNNFPNLAILILTNKITKADLNELSKIRIKNIIYKSIDRDDLLAAIDATLKGKKYYSGEVLDLLMEQTNTRPAEDPITLTPSETEIVRKIANGLTTKEIAAEKNISFHTVITHRKNIFRKLEINNSSELIMYAMRKGIIDAVDYII